MIFDHSRNISEKKNFFQTIKNSKSSKMCENFIVDEFVEGLAQLDFFSIVIHLK